MYLLVELLDISWAADIGLKIGLLKRPTKYNVNIPGREPVVTNFALAPVCYHEICVKYFNVATMFVVSRKPNPTELAGHHFDILDSASSCQGSML